MTTNDMLSFTIFKNQIVKTLITKGFFKVSFVIFLQNILSTEIDNVSKIIKH